MIGGDDRARTRKRCPKAIDGRLRSVRCSGREQDELLIHRAPPRSLRGLPVRPTHSAVPVGEIPNVGWWTIPAAA
jgi:hypothetical protein